MKIALDNLDFQQCAPACLNEIMQIQAEAFAELNDKDLLRHNSAEMLLECLSPPQFTLGAWYEEVLIAFSVLYFPQNDVENLSLDLMEISAAGLKTANNKLCIVRKDYRGNSLQVMLGHRLETTAKNSQIDMLCATVSPKNTYSIRNILQLGYIYNRTLLKYGLERNLYYKCL